MLEKIIDIIYAQADLNLSDINITADTNLKTDLEMDSLEAVEIIMAIEDEFNIEIEDDLIDKLSTVGDLVEYIERRVF